MSPWNQPHRAVEMPRELRNRWIDRDPELLVPTRIQKPIDKRQPIDGWLVAMAVSVVLMAVFSVWAVIKVAQVIAS